MSLVKKTILLGDCQRGREERCRVERADDWQLAGVGDHIADMVIGLPRAGLLPRPANRGRRAVDPHGLAAHRCREVTRGPAGAAAEIEHPIPLSDAARLGERADLAGGEALLPDVLARGIRGG